MKTIILKPIATVGKYLMLMGRTLSRPERMRMFFKQYVKETTGADVVYVQAEQGQRQQDIPDAQLAIEPGSWYWHKDKVKRDLEKQRLCRNNGIRLIIIYDSFDGDRGAYDFDNNVITIQHNLGELSYRDELDSLIQLLLKQLTNQQQSLRKRGIF